MRRLILILVRKRLGLKEGELFRFTNQKSKAKYYFDDQLGLVKVGVNSTYLSGASLNWILDPFCEIEKVSQSCSQSYSQS